MTVEYLKNVIRLSKVLAIWPLEGKPTKFRFLLHYAVNFTVTSLIILNSVGLVLQVAINYQDMENIATVIDFGTLYLSAVFRCVYIFKNGRRYLQLAETMYSTFIYESLNSGPNKLTMATFQDISFKVSGTYFIGSMMFAVHTIINPFYKYGSSTNMTQIPLLFDVWFPLDLTAEPAHSIMLTVQGASWLSLAYLYLITDVLWYSVVILSIGQMRLIAHSFNHIAPTSDQEFTVETRQCFTKCVTQHRYLRRFISLIEDLSNPIVIVDFMHAIISITFILLDITIAMSEGNWGRFATMFEYFMVSVTHMFFYNYLGNELALQEDELAKALYNVPWYLDCPSLQAPLVLTTAAARKPNRLSGGKFFHLTNEFFAGSMRTIFSYFMVLQQLHDESQ